MLLYAFIDKMAKICNCICTCKCITIRCLVIPMKLTTGNFNWVTYVAIKRLPIINGSLTRDHYTNPNVSPNNSLALFWRKAHKFVTFLHEQKDFFLFLKCVFFIFSFFKSETFSYHLVKLSLNSNPEFSFFFL